VNHVAIEFALTAIATRSLSASERPPSASSASALSAAGYQVYAVNPLAVARYRDRHQVSGAKSDTGDAKLLADLVRTDRHNHRPLSGDSAQAEAIKVLARGHQNLIWARTRHTNALRSALREYYPAALQAFDNLADRDALAVLGRAPSPQEAARLSLAKVRSALKHAGRQRNIDARAQEILAALRTKQLTAPSAITAAFAAATRAAVAVIGELNHQIADLEAELATHFETRPDADIYLSLPGLRRHRRRHCVDAGRRITSRYVLGGCGPGEDRPETGFRQCPGSLRPVR